MHFYKNCLLATSSYNICHPLHVTFSSSLTFLNCSLDLDLSVLIWIQIVLALLVLEVYLKKVILNKISRLSIQISKHTKIYKTQSMRGDQLEL